LEIINLNAENLIASKIIELEVFPFNYLDRVILILISISTILLIYFKVMF